MFLWFWINKTEHITRSFITVDRRRYRTQSWSGNTPRRRRKGRKIKWPRDANSCRWDQTKAEKKITQILKTVPDNFSSFSVADYFNHLRHFLCVLPSQKTGGCLWVKEWRKQQLCWPQQLAAIINNHQQNSKWTFDQSLVAYESTDGCIMHLWWWQQQKNIRFYCIHGSKCWMQIFEPMLMSLLCFL